MTASYADETAFHDADPRRRTSDEVDLGATWRSAGSPIVWRLGWLHETGELYLCQNVGFPGPSEDVRLLAVVPSETGLDVLLAGWQEHRADEDGLGWLSRRLAVA